MEELLVNRTVDVDLGLTVQLRVPLAIARKWCPEFQRGERLLIEAAESRALREALTLLRKRGVAQGRWCVTWTRAGSPQLEQLDRTRQSPQ